MSADGRTSRPQSGRFGPCPSDESAMITNPAVAVSRDRGGPDRTRRPSEAQARSSPRGGAPSHSRSLLATGLILGGIASMASVVLAGHAARDRPPDDRDLDREPGNTAPPSKELREHLRRAPHDGAARMMLARVLAASGDLAGCTRELHQVPAWWPQKAEALYREGQAYLLMNRARDAEAASAGGHRCRPLASGGSGRLPRCQPGAALALCHRGSLGRRARHPVEGLRSGDARVPADRAGDANPVRAGADRPDRVGQAAGALRGRRSRGLGGPARAWPTPSWRWASAPRPSATCETAWMPGPRTPASGATT